MVPISRARGERIWVGWAPADPKVADLLSRRWSNTFAPSSAKRTGRIAGCWSTLQNTSAVNGHGIDLGPATWYQAGAL
jgi:hypothetical protein